MKHKTKPRRVPLLWILLPFTAGICYARFFPVPPFWLAFLLSLSLAAASIYSVRKWELTWPWILLFLPTAFSIGLLRFVELDRSDQKEIPSIAREATLELRIDSLFNASDPETALGIATVSNTPLHQDYLIGVRLFFFLEVTQLPSYPVEGETFRTIGVIRRIPEASAGDRFDAYLRNQGISVIYKQGDFLDRTAAATGLKKWTNRMQARMSEILSKNKVPDSPLTGAYHALMLGQKGELSAAQKQLFLANGTMHLFAISGLHIGVIALCFHHLLGILQIRGGYKIVGALLGICAFVLVTGGSASSWRAALMIACLYLVNTVRRQPSPVNALALSAIIYLFIVPRQLFQAGFQMSYLTVATILLLGLPLAKTLNQLTPLFGAIPVAAHTRIQKSILLAKRWTLDTLGVSIAAFLISALLGIYYFQILPSYGVVINMLALPIASLAIVAGFLSILFSPISGVLPVSELFNNAALLLISIVHKLLELTSSFPASSLQTPPANALVATAAVLSTLGVVATAYCQRADTPRFAWQALAILTPLTWIAYLHA